MLNIAVPGLLLLLISVVPAAGAPPVLDVHLHAMPVDGQGPPPLAMCTPIDPMPHWDPRGPFAETFLKVFKEPSCDDPIWSPTTDEELLQRTIDTMTRRNVYGVLSGTPERVAAWREAAPGRFYAGLGFRLDGEQPTPDGLRALHEAGRLDVLAEVTNQYLGVAPDDERMEPYWAAMEELDVPVGIHIGTGPPGVIYLDSPNYRARLHSALSLEEVLVHHPGLRVYVMHAGYPMLDDMLAVLYAHPQVYVGVGVIVYTQPRPAFYRYLKALVEAGFGGRVMFGSDQMVWPEAIDRSIAVIEEAPFLSAQQKRDILYNNAARFLRLSDEEIARHHGEDAAGE